MDYSIAKIKDKIKIYIKTGKPTSSFFLTPTEQIEATYILKNMPFSFCGGYEQAERKIIVIGEENASIEEFCSLIRICSKNKELTHREVLGSLLGLGIKREIIGDIIISGQTADIIVIKEMKDYILNNMKAVGREKITIKEINFSNIEEFKLNSTIKNITVASLRIDAIISTVYGVSREKSNTIISLEKVMINYLPCINNSKSIKKGDLISVRGYGRIKIIDIIGETRKGRQRISVEIF